MIAALFLRYKPGKFVYLSKILNEALTGHGKVAIVRGEAGSGKTAMLNAFARLAQANQPDLVVASGICNAYTGVGDPYLPFREILAMLTGDTESP